MSGEDELFPQDVCRLSKPDVTRNNNSELCYMKLIYLAEEKEELKVQHGEEMVH